MIKRFLKHLVLQLVMATTTVIMTLVMLFVIGCVEVPLLIRVLVDIFLMIATMIGIYAIWVNELQDKEKSYVSTSGVVHVDVEELLKAEQARLQLEAAKRIESEIYASPKNDWNRK